METELTILLTNYNTTDLIGVTLEALPKLTDRSYIVLINDNGSKPVEMNRLIKLAQRFPNVWVHFRTCEGEASSLAHGTALDTLMQHVRTRYTAVFDSDATVLLKHWDTLLISQLNGQDKIIGTPRLEEGMVVGTDLTAGFPYQFIVVFETAAFQALNISWKPDISFLGPRMTPEHDLAWEVQQKFQEAGHQGIVFLAKNTRHHRTGRFHELLGVAEYYLPDSRLIGSHFGRGSSAGAAKYNAGWRKQFYRIPWLGSQLRKRRGDMDKQHWITICKKIISEQT